MASKKSTDVKANAESVWLAGLGALAVAEEEGGKMFRSLVDRGKEYEKRLRKPVDRAGSRVRGTVKDVRSRAGKVARKVGETVDDGVSAVLGRLGIPTRDDIAELSRRIERLSDALAVKAGGATAAKKSAKKKTATRKKTTRKTAEA